MTVHERPLVSRSSVLIEAGRFELREESIDPPSETTALVRVTYTGICGSDFPIVDGLHPRAPLPLVLGHEITGVIESPGGSRLAAGTPVAVNPLLACLDCTACSQGFFHVCKNLKIIGIDTAGSLSELLAVPVQNLYPFSSLVDPVQAAFAEPLAVAIHAVRRSRLARAERVLIFGAGPIGMLVALVARQMGAGQVSIVETSVQRRSVVEELGLTALEPTDVGTGRMFDVDAPDVIFDCAGHPSLPPLLTAFASVRGRIVIVALHQTPTSVDLKELALSEQEIIGTRVYTCEDFADAVRYIGEDALGLDRIPVTEYDLESVGEAFAEARSGKGAIKVLVRSNTRPPVYSEHGATS